MLRQQNQIWLSFFQIPFRVKQNHAVESPTNWAGCPVNHILSKPEEDETGVFPWLLTQGIFFLKEPALKKELLPKCSPQKLLSKPIGKLVMMV
jgi:hypothetical protein